MNIEMCVHKKLVEFDLSLQFSSIHKRVGILGASGSGKSLTLKSLAGIIKPDSGEIRLEDKTVFSSEKNINISPQNRSIGYLFQNYALFPNMSVEDNIRCGIQSKKRCEQNRIISELLSKYQLEDCAKEKPTKLSGGQQQRVAIARIMAYQPSLVLLDEPFSALDQYLREIMRRDMDETMNQYNGTCFLVSHSRDDIYLLSDYLYIMHQGKIIEQGLTKAVFQSPQRELTARLTGCKNISQASLLDHNRVYAIEWGIELVVSEELLRGASKGIQSIGIRAHDIRFSNGEGQNSFAVTDFIVQEFAFERQYQVSLSKGDSHKRLWCSISQAADKQDQYSQPPSHIYIPSDKILLFF